MTPLTSSPGRPARNSFRQLLRAEWTKFSTVRGWVFGAVGALVAIVLVGLLATGASNRDAEGTFPTDAGGRAVDDNFYFVNQPLTGDGSITVAVGLSGKIDGQEAPEAVPWAKAGLIIKDSLTQGSDYAAIMVTGSHGIRMQYGFIQDVAGLPGNASPASPRWLRLTRTGDTITGYNSADGATWTRVGSVRLAGLASTAQVGLFTASPQSMSLGDNGASFGPAVGIGRFERIKLADGWTQGTWAGRQVGGQGSAGSSGSYSETLSGGFTTTNGAVTVTGAGDIAPVVSGTGAKYTLENFLVGAFAGLIILIVVGVGFITTEFRSSMVRTTFTASPRRSRVLLAKTVVVAGVGFVVGLVGSLAAIIICVPIAKANGFPVLTVPLPLQVRVIIGTGLLLAVASVLALGVGTVMRRSATAVTVVIAGMILPYILALSGVLPTVPSEWLLRVTPSAGFSIQQSVERYDQVLTSYTPSAGYYPLGPWVGFGVLCAYAAIAMVVASIRLNQRDA